MKSNVIKRVFVYGGLTKDEYDQIRPLVWKRNKRILYITSVLAGLMGLVFLIYALISRSGTWFSYLFLLCGSAAVFLLNKMTEHAANELLAIFLCYSQMLFVGIYAGILSTQESNYAIPATSVVVFIALLPLSVDDRPARMYAFMFAESAAYLIISYFFKSSGAFSLDVMNVATFSVVGMILYGFICTRNIRQIYQSMRVDKIQHSVISSLATVVEERDESTGSHIVRTENYVAGLIGEMKKSGFFPEVNETFYNNVMLAAPMHDIGKIKIPDAILNKPGRLTPEEYEIMKKHSEYGAEIIGKTMCDVEEKDYLEIACNIAQYHHERYDGKGYPEGLKGEKIPLEARIMALADVYDALVSVRVYKDAYSRKEARMIIEEGAGTLFDPTLTQLFLNCI